MRKPLKIVGLTMGVLLVLMIARAYFGNTSYFFIVPGARLYADGEPVSGWLHRGAKRRSFILTRSDGSRTESFYIAMPNEKGAWILSCGDWAAPRFPLVALGDYSACLSEFGDRPDSTPKKPERTPIFGSRSVEFTADNGSRLKISW
jgi:hypothetical protein